MATGKELIAQSKWAQTLTPEEKGRVDAETVVRTVPKGSYVCRRGEPVHFWIGVLEGLVKIATVSHAGKPATFSGIPSGGWFGEGSLLKDMPRPYEAVALRNSEIAYLPRGLFLWLLDNNARFCRVILEQINERLGQAMAIIESDRLLGPEGRVAQCLAGMFNPILYPRIGQSLRFSQEEIALLVGLSRQRVNQAVKVLQERDVLEVQYGGVAVHDPEKLRRFQE
ncbi:MAG TPA: Crp/Fnr family transcriptional regulator [Burkholderiaceae bacterium]|nr:Crp/Fnr family transcriptional regulator [Burkholderiaceae bacterium]